jgi:lactoylglutathione lyase
MERIVHIVLKCKDKDTFERSTKLCEKVFGIYQTKIGQDRGHTSRHMTDGNIDRALMVYDSDDEKEAKQMIPSSAKIIPYRQRRSSLGPLYRALY